MKTYTIRCGYDIAFDWHYVRAETVINGELFICHTKILSPLTKRKFASAVAKCVAELFDHKPAKKKKAA